MRRFQGFGLDCLADVAHRCPTKREDPEWEISSMLEFLGILQMRGGAGTTKEHVACNERGQQHVISIKRNPNQPIVSRLLGTTKRQNFKASFGICIRISWYYVTN